MSPGLFKMLPKKYSFTNNIYLVYMNKQYLAMNNQQGLICHKRQPTKNDFNDTTWVSPIIKYTFSQLLRKIVFKTTDK